jgi:hypothetical protein
MPPSAYRGRYIIFSKFSRVLYGKWPSCVGLRSWLESDHEMCSVLTARREIVVAVEDADYRKKEDDAVL